MSYQSLPPDMKRKLAETVDPAEALELCKTVECNWKELLDLNYDFVTQGFAVGTTDQEKFTYLAERVSKNVRGAEPKIIFVHWNGVPLGKTRFFGKDNDDEDYMEEQQNRRSAIIRTLRESPSVEWVQEDENNAWIYVKDPKSLPQKIVVEGNGHNMVLRDFDIYDYPSERAEKISENSYPGTVSIDLEIIKEAANRILDEEPEEEFNSEFEVMLKEMMLMNTTSVWKTYSAMLEGFSRSEAEVFSLIAGDASPTTDYFRNLKKLEKEYSVEKRLIVYLEKKPILKFYVKPGHTLTDIENYFQNKHPGRKLEFYKGRQKVNYDYNIDRIVLK